jgi:transposase
MSKGKRKFTEQQMKQLEANPNVHHVTENAITYTPLFKVTGIKAYQAGKIPQEIFMEAGFDLSTIDPRKPRKCLQRWRKV